MKRFPQYSNLNKVPQQQPILLSGIAFWNPLVATFWGPFCILNWGAVKGAVGLQALKGLVISYHIIPYLVWVVFRVL